MKSQRSKILIIENTVFQYTYRLMVMIEDKYRSLHDFRINNIKRHLQQLTWE